MPQPDAEGMFSLFEAYPSLLPEAGWIPPGNYVEAIIERRKLGKPCIHCGAISRVAMLATHQQAKTKHWIDLCPECAVWVREAIKRVMERKNKGA